LIIKVYLYVRIKNIYRTKILIPILSFLDEIAMLSDSEENLKKMLFNFNKTLKQKYNMKMNISKTKILVCSSRAVLKSGIGGVSHPPSQRKHQSAVELYHYSLGPNFIYGK
jgi:hypothetical protein